MGVPALFKAKIVPGYGTVYESRVTSRRYLVEKKIGGFIRVVVITHEIPHNGRCVYGGHDPDKAFGMIELEDCI